MGEADIGARLRALRGSPPRISQEELGSLLGRNQRWISERERGGVGTTVAEASEIAAALGFVAELVIVPLGEGALLRALASLDPQGVAVVLRLAAVWSELDPALQAMLSAVVLQAEQSTRDTASRG